MILSTDLQQRIHSDIREYQVNRKKDRELTWSCSDVSHEKIDAFVKEHLSYYIQSRNFCIVTVSHTAVWKVSQLGKCFFQEETHYHIHDRQGVLPVGYSEISDFTLGRTILQITTSNQNQEVASEEIVSCFSPLFQEDEAYFYEWRYEKIQNCRDVNQVVSSLFNEGLISLIDEPYVVLEGGKVSTRQSITVSKMTDPWIEVVRRGDFEEIEETKARFQEELLDVCYQCPMIKRFAFNITKLDPASYGELFIYISELGYSFDLDTPFIDAENFTSDYKRFKQYLMVDLIPK